MSQRRESRIFTTKDTKDTKKRRFFNTEDAEGTEEKDIMSDIDFSSRRFEIKGTSPEAWIIITPLSLSDPQAHSIEARVEVRLNEYSGVQNLHLFWDDLEKFIHQLVTLDKSRKGLANWQAPGGVESRELDLAIETIDNSGHMKVCIKIQSRHCGEIKWLSQALSGEFEYDSGSLPNLIANLQKLMQLEK